MWPKRCGRWASCMGIEALSAKVISESRGHVEIPSRELTSSDAYVLADFSIPYRVFMIINQNISEHRNGYYSSTLDNIPSRQYSCCLRGHIISSGGKPMQKSDATHIAGVLKTLTILNPNQLSDPIDARTIASILALSPRQVSSCLSKLKELGYLTKVGSDARYACYIRTQKPLPNTSSSIERRYRIRTMLKQWRKHSTSQRHRSSRNFRRSIKRTKPAEHSGQLSLFCDITCPAPNPMSTLPRRGYRVG
jgi:hypothetical protein